jgi:quercetin dioxygenase-like cupin family protein
MRRHLSFFILICCCLIVLLLRSGGYAQQAAPGPPPATPPAPTRGVLGPAPGFTGNTTTLDTTGYTIGKRVFEAGAHNATFHAHSAGQLVFAEAGQGRLQLKGGPIQELATGASVFIPGGVMHWHGASPTGNFTMVYVTMGTSTTTQGEPVTEAVYLGKSK